jgi:hypothetical protein
MKFKVLQKLRITEIGRVPVFTLPPALLLVCSCCLSRMHIYRTTRTKGSTGFRSVERGLQDNCLDAFGVNFPSDCFAHWFNWTHLVRFTRVHVIAQNKIGPSLLCIRDVKWKLVLALTFDITAFYALYERLCSA